MDKCWLFLLVFAVSCRLCSLSLYLYIRGWYESNYHLYTHGFECLDLEHNYPIWTQHQWDFLIKGKWWFSFWAIDDDPYVMTYYLKADAKLIYRDRHIVLSFLQGEIFGHHCGLSLMVSLQWVVVIEHKIFLVRIVFFC